MRTYVQVQKQKLTQLTICHGSNNETTGQMNQDMWNQIYRLRSRCRRHKQGETPINA